MGALVVRNTTGATLTLRCLRHYGDNTPCAFADKSMRGLSVFLAGPADYELTAQAGTAWQVRYPVYIEGYGHRVAVAVEPPPARMPEGMAFIPGGVFRMGTKDTRGGTSYAEELPAHDVEVDGFFMDRYEVTNAQYRQCVTAGQCPAAHYDDGTCFSRVTITGWEKGEVDSAFQEDTKPVICIDWPQAQAYCEFRGKRLPTEAEWEKAAVGPEGYKWAFGNQFDGTRVNYCDKNCRLPGRDTQSNNRYKTTVPVGMYRAYGYGLYDMSGNVVEWVADWYDPNFYAKPESRQKNPENRESGGLRVARGGSWATSNAESLRATFRFRYGPTVRTAFVGVRCVASPPR
jgi:formylglycine-generating enzyme required for sulfatase activity